MAPKRSLGLIDGCRYFLYELWLMVGMCEKTSCRLSNGACIQTNKRRGRTSCKPSVPLMFPRYEVKIRWEWKLIVDHSMNCISVRHGNKHLIITLCQNQYNVSSSIRHFIHPRLTQWIFFVCMFNLSSHPNCARPQSYYTQLSTFSNPTP